MMDAAQYQYEQECGIEWPEPTDEELAEISLLESLPEEEGWQVYASEEGIEAFYVGVN